MSVPLRVEQPLGGAPFEVAEVLFRDAEQAEAVGVLAILAMIVASPPAGETAVSGETGEEIDLLGGVFRIKDFDAIPGQILYP